MRGEQQNALKQISREEDFEEQIQDMAAKLREYKKHYREVYYEQIGNDRTLIEKHDQLVRLDKKVKKMQQQIKDHQDGGGKVKRSEGTPSSQVLVAL